MARERCLKKSFQDSLEDIKERMKEKRTRKLAKVATVKKALSTKVKIINNSASVVKSFQANNQALAQALEVEKSKCRQAQDLILHLRREHQRLMFEIFLLRRKLNMQQGNNQAESKLASLKEIITKVTHNLLETANLLGPAHALCSSDYNSAMTPSAVKEHATPTGSVEKLEPCGPVTDAGRNINCGIVCGRRKIHEVLETSENKTPVNRLSKGLKPSSSQPNVEFEDPDLEVRHDKKTFKHVSFRRRPSALKICVEESTTIEPLNQSQRLNSESHVLEPEDVVPVEESKNDDIMDIYPDPSPSKEELIPFTNCQLSSSTPEPKPKQAVPKGTNDSRTGREKARKYKTDGASAGQLKKPWEKSKARARSKSRERGASKPVISKEKMNTSLNSGDAYDFVVEESIHVTPFRANKLGSEIEEDHHDQEAEVEKSNKSSSSEEDLNGSLYMPSKAKAKNHNVEQGALSLPLRPRSKRSKAVHPQLTEKPANKTCTPAKQDITRGKKNTRSALKGQVENDTGNKFASKAEEIKENLSIPNKNVYSDAAKQSIEVLSALKDDVTHTKDRNIDDSKGPPLTQRIGLSDVTNFPAISGSAEAKKRSFPLSNNDEMKMSESCGRKRRCTVTVNYAEPSLHKKLRRGDPFTDTEFLSSPIFKNNDVNRKSLSRQSLARYNEAFVGCR